MRALEQRYRALLRLYPKRYRDRVGEEMLGVLLNRAGPERRWPPLAEVLGLVRHAVAHRTDLGGRGVLARALAPIASPALALAAVLSGLAFGLGEWAPRSAPPRPPIGAIWWPFATIGPVIYLCWIVAAALDLAGQVRWRRLAILFAAAASVLSVPVAWVTPLGRPPLFFLGCLFALALPALLVEGRRRLSGATVAVLGLSTLALLSVSLSSAPVGLAEPGAWYRLGLTAVASWAPVVVVPLLAGAAAATLSGRGSLSASLVVGALPWLLIALALTPHVKTAPLDGLLLMALATMLVAIDRAGRRQAAPAAARGRDAQWTAR